MVGQDDATGGEVGVGGAVFEFAGEIDFVVAGASGVVLTSSMSWPTEAR